MQKILMGKGARQVTEVCAQVKKGEKVLIITEPKLMYVAESVSKAGNTIVSEHVISIIESRSSDGEESPVNIAAAMKESDVFISAFYTSITHTYAVKHAVENGSRGIMLTQFDENMLVDSGVHADFPQAVASCELVAAILQNA